MVAYVSSVKERASAVWGGPMLVVAQQRGASVREYHGE